jgi:phage shock protein PspC (stress-responsive transcriptional regulator)
MNKTISIHLQGIPFLIEENAYQLLKNYLDRLSEVLNQEEGEEEIKQDIEIRMAELFSKALGTNKKVLEQKMVEEVLQKLGDPKVFVSDEEKQTNSKSSTQYSTEKRLFRDEDNSVIGGVCAGFANYFGIDVVIMRAIFVLVSLIGGFGLPLYFILWIITPKAKTSIEKLQMKGEPINFDTMKSEIEKTADKLKNNSKHWAQKVKNDKTIENSAKGVIRIISVGVGLFFLLMGTGLFITALIFLFIDPDFIPAQVNGEFMSLGKFGQLILESGRDTQNLIWGIVLTFAGAIGIFWLIGIRLLISFRSKILNYSTIILLAVCFIGIILLAVTGARTGRAFAIDGEVEKEIATIDKKELFLDFTSSPTSEKDGYKTISKGESGFLKVENGKVFFHGIEIEYQKSDDTLFHINQFNSVQSKDHKSALKKARNIKLGFNQNENHLNFDTFYTFPVDDKIRDQEVKLIIQVPDNGIVKVKNKVVYPAIKQQDKKLEEKSQAYVDGEGSYEAW